MEKKPIFSRLHFCAHALFLPITRTPTRPNIHPIFAQSRAAPMRPCPFALLTPVQNIPNCYKIAAIFTAKNTTTTGRTGYQTFWCADAPNLPRRRATVAPTPPRHPKTKNAEPPMMTFGSLWGGLVPPLRAQALSISQNILHPGRQSLPEGSSISQNILHPGRSSAKIPPVISQNTPHPDLLKLPDPLSDFPEHCVPNKNFFKKLLTRCTARAIIPAVKGDFHDLLH